MGFKGSGQEFVLPNEELWVLLGIQRSRWSDSKGLDFTVQLTVAHKKIWKALAESRGYGERPRSTRFYGPAIWQKRLGALLPGGADKWWPVHADTDLRALGTELVAAIGEYGLPALQAQMSSTTNGDEDSYGG